MLKPSGDTLSDHMWTKPGQQVWSDGKLSHCMRQLSRRAQIDELHLQNWRHICVSIMKTKFLQGEQSFFDLDNDEDADFNDPVQLGNWQRNHSTRIANQAYANANVIGTWDDLVHRARKASGLWQQLWRLDDLWQESSSTQSDAFDRLSAIAIRTTAHSRARAYSALDLLKSARDLLRESNLAWTSKYQKRAMKLVMSSAEAVVAIIPTGGGKSLLFMLPAYLDSTKVTIVVLPLVALRQDMLRRLMELGLRHSCWSSTNADLVTPVILVSVEAAVTNSFLFFALRLQRRGCLERVVLVEAHLSLSDEHYQAVMLKLVNLRILAVQFLYLTATLPPSMEETSERFHALDHPTYVRAPSKRSKLSYIVVRTAAKSRPELHQMSTELWNLDVLFADRVAVVTDDIDRLSVAVNTNLLHPSLRRQSHTSQQLLSAAQDMLQLPSLKWKSQSQKRAVRAVMDKQPQLIVVLPTGGGKSMLFMLPAFLNSDRVTVLILALIALRVDLMRRFGQAGITYSCWPSMNPAPLVVVSTEAASSESFHQHLLALERQNVLDRVVLDEAHMSVSEDHYRPQMRDLVNLRVLTAQFVYLTATLPPSMEQDLTSLHALDSPLTIRTSSNRSNLYYSVLRLSVQDTQGLRIASVDTIKALVAQSPSFVSDSKGFVYVRTRRDATVTAELLG